MCARISGVDPGPALATTTMLGYSGFLIGPPCIGFAAELLGLRPALTIVLFTSALIVVLAHHGVADDRSPCASVRLT